MAIRLNAKKEETRGAWTSAQIEVRLVSPGKQTTIIHPLPDATVPNAPAQTNLVFLNLDIAVSRRSDSYLVRVVQSPVGGTTTSFRLQFRPDEWASLCTMMKLSEQEAGNFFVDRIDEQNRDEPNKAQEQSISDAQHLGSRLFTSLFQSVTGNALARSLDLVKEQNRGLRIRLNFSEASELWRLPWEMLYDPSRNSFLSLQETISIERYINLPSPRMTRPTTAPLHILVVSLSQLRINFFEELKALQTALQPLLESRHAILTRLDQPSLTELESALRQQDYDILHFVGVGEIDETTGSNTIIFEDENRRERKVPSEQVSRLLSGFRSLRLAVFNIGHSEELCQRLIRKGMSAAIGAQSSYFDQSEKIEFPDEEAILFTESLYKSIVEGYSVESALTKARIRIKLENLTLAGWASLVLYTSSSDGQILPPFVDANA